MPTPEELQRAAVATGLRDAAASLICLVVTERFQLGMGFMSVLSAHLIITQFQYTTFQKGVERILGRFSGVLFGLVLVVFFRETPALYLSLFLIAQVIFFYVYASGRMSYAAIQGGAFSVVVVATGITSPPAAAFVVAAETAAQILLGVGAALLVVWTTGTEYSLAIETKGDPLLPLRADWLSRSCMMTTMTALSMLVSIFFQLPVIPTVVSAAILGTALKLEELEKKAYQRAAGPLVAGSYALLVILILSRIPYFSLLAVFLFLGMFLSGYYTKASTQYSYAALQTGLTVPMILVGPLSDITTLTPAIERLLGVAAGFATTLIVQVLWPAPRKDER